MKQQYLSLTFLFIYTFSFGQNISISTLTSAGDFSKNENGISMSWTMGQVFANTIQENNHLTEGFQQGELKTGIIEEENLIEDFDFEVFTASELEVDMEVFPNPTVNYLNLKFKTSQTQSVFVRISTLGGMNISEQEIDIENRLEIQLDQFKNLKPGSYLISIVKNEEIISTKQVIKL